MFANWTLGRRIAGSFILMVLLAVMVALVAVSALQYVVQSKDEIIVVDGPLLVQAARLQTQRTTLTSQFRSYLLSASPDDLETVMNGRASLDEQINALKAQVRSPAEGALVETIINAVGAYNTSIDAIVRLRQAGTNAEQANATYLETVRPPAVALSEAINAYIDYLTATLDASRQWATDVANFAIALIVIGFAIKAIVATLLGFQLTRYLNRNIVTAVGHMQNSSAELQSASNQQATGVKEQATSMSEISTTINELLATSHQIAESAQRVTQIAEGTANATRAGDASVNMARGLFADIRQQTDRVVELMLELGQKSQEIGLVLDLVTELAEQTNILSINATIEAAGVGEAGRRFGVVAEEVRKLAERVSSSTKEVRAQIEGMRSSVNATVMATETNSKAVDSGARQFAEVATLFRDIAESAATTSEAVREIELSTKQQATAVEQVNVAIVNATQASREMEASVGQTIQTASELAGSSRSLMRLVRSDANA